MLLYSSIALRLSLTLKLADSAGQWPAILLACLLPQHSAFCVGTGGWTRFWAHLLVAGLGSGPYLLSYLPSL